MAEKYELTIKLLNKRNFTEAEIKVIFTHTCEKVKNLNRFAAPENAKLKRQIREKLN